ncbi:MAG TPA: DNA replication/repair protein RecF [Erysipelotrichaceae bacterium]|nr:DNA replication/repair protein RecF [Erysipelotrichaceae bacterium]
MLIKKITLKNFRNHSFLSFDFSNNLNVLTGPNAIGKTNVVEAIYYLSLGHSFRTEENTELIKKNRDKAEIDAVVTEGDFIRKIKIVIAKNGRMITINNKNIKKLSELSKCVNVILFQPKDVTLFSGPPKKRRNFLDISISKKSNIYLGYISRYDKVLKERNNLLKEEQINRTLLDVTTELIIKLSGSIISYRQMYVKNINDILNKITRALTGTRETLELKYYPFVLYDANFTENARKAFKRAEENDFKRKQTSIGIHREDISISLNGRDIAKFGSQGENRIASLALKLSPYFLIEDNDKKPIVVLDDVMSELDYKHQEKLIKFLTKFNQVFITGTKLDIPNCNHLLIKPEAKEVS